MRFAVLTYQHVSNPLGFPDAYPAETKLLSEGQAAESPWVEMSAFELSALQLAHAQAVDAIQAASRNTTPEEVLLWQFRAAVTLAGLKDAVDAAVAALPEPSKTVATEKWEYGNTVRRNHAMISSLSASLGLTSTQVDNIFKTAASLQ